MKEPTGPLGRRAVLGCLVGTVAGVSGCIGRIRSTIDRDSPRQISLTIKTVPADEDLPSVRIARHLQQNFELAGASVTVQPTTEEQLLREVLINKNFDVYVGQHPGHDDPDFLRPFLHSRFSEEPGWQNPFSYSNISVDELLEDQQIADEERAAILTNLQRMIVRDPPFVPVVFPDDARVVRNDRFTGWDEMRLSSPLGYLGIEPIDQHPEDTDALSDSTQTTLRIGTIDRRSSRNLNPIAVEFRDYGTITGLLYDPIAYRYEGGYIPWVAREWTWLGPTGARHPTLELELRQGLRWHDDAPLTAEDVTFTFRFLSDTTMTDDDPIIPSPRFRGRTSLVDTVDTIDSTTIRLQFAASSREVAIRALTIPVLPKHVWENYTAPTEIAGIELQTHTTEALTWANTEPIGSGPFEFENLSVDTEIELKRFDQHFLQRPVVEGEAGVFAGRPRFDRLVFRVMPSVANLVEFVLNGDLDGTGRSIGSDHFQRTEGNEDVAIQVHESTQFYHIGFNIRRAPFANSRFRQAVARLIDRDFLQSEVFDGFSRPILSPLADTSFVPPDLTWPATSDHEFVGESGTGEVNLDLVRDLFREAGFSYNADGELLSQ